MENLTPPTTNSTPSTRHGLRKSAGCTTPISTSRARLTEHQELILMEVCRDRFGGVLEGHSQIKVWVEISQEFQKRAGRTFSWQSCARRFRDRVKREKTRINLAKDHKGGAELPSNPASRFVNEWIRGSQEALMIEMEMQEQQASQEAKQREQTVTKQREQTVTKPREQTVTKQAWEERMNGWVQSSTDPRFFSHETAAVDNVVSVGGPLMSSDPVMSGKNHLLPPPRVVSQNDLKEISDKIDRVAENILNSTKLLLKEFQLQQRREMKEFQERVLTQMRDHCDLVSENIFDAQREIQEEETNHISTLNDGINDLQRLVRRAENHILRLKGEMVDTIEASLATQERAK